MINSIKDINIRNSSNKIQISGKWNIASFKQDIIIRAEEVNLDMPFFNTTTSFLNNISEIAAGKQFDSASSAYEWMLRLANFSRVRPTACISSELNVELE